MIERNGFTKKKNVTNVTKSIANTKIELLIFESNNLIIYTCSLCYISVLHISGELLIAAGKANEPRYVYVRILTRPPLRCQQGLFISYSINY